MVSNAWDSHESAGWGAAWMPPAAATECERTGWTLETMPTVAPACAAARAARWAATPAPMIRTSWEGMPTILWKPRRRRLAPGGTEQRRGQRGDVGPRRAGSG